MTAQGTRSCESVLPRRMDPDLIGESRRGKVTHGKSCGESNTQQGCRVC